jgi:hypothetical protein
MTNLAARAAYAGAALFVVLIVYSLLGIGQGPTPVFIAMGVVGAASHLVLLPVVAAMPAPEWARAAGYGWLVIDTMLSVAAVNGLDPNLAGMLRLGGHASSALWMATAAQQSKGAVRAIGWPLAVVLMVHAFGARWLPAWVSFPPFVMIPVWLVCIAVRLKADATDGRRP